MSAKDKIGSIVFPQECGSAKACLLRSTLAMGLSELLGNAQTVKFANCHLEGEP